MSSLDVSSRACLKDIVASYPTDRTPIETCITTLAKIDRNGKDETYIPSAFQRAS